MKKLAVTSVSCFASAGIMLTYFVVRQEPLIRAQTSVNGIAIGGLTRAEAQRKLRIWWESERQVKIPILATAEGKPLAEWTPTQLGVRFDDAATVATLPTQSLIDDGRKLLGQDFEPFIGKPAFSQIPINWGILRKLYLETAPPARPATVLYQKGAILKTSEVPGTELVTDSAAEQVLPAVLATLDEGSPKPIVLGLREAPKQIEDDVLDSIREVVSSYSTGFPASQTSRNTNIRLAAQKLDGLILKPGDTFSFNTIVGERSAKNGYKLAGVYRQGRHDTGIGGGICQVSSTLYNAVLFANLAIKRRTNHSMPVAYVPVGRDATVSYPALDFVFENSTQGAIAISSQYQAGRLTFRVLGTKEPGLLVKVTQEDHETWDRGEKIIPDPTLRVGARKVIDKGSRRHRIKVIRWVYQNGTLVKKEALGTSNYIGGPRLIGVGVPATPKPGVTTSLRSDARP